MGTATVIGRDELGRIIDVQVTTEEDIAPPGPETVAAGGGDAEQIIYTRTIILTNDQVKALVTTSIEVVPAPGAGFGVVPISGFVDLDATAGSYTNLSNDARLALANDVDNNFNALTLDTATGGTTAASIFGGGRRFAWLIPNIQVIAGPALVSRVYVAADTTFENESIHIYANNTNGDFTGGHADNTLKITVWYGIFEY